MTIDNASPDGWLWRPSAASNRWIFTTNPMRRKYPKDALFVPVHFDAPAVTWGDLHELLSTPCTHQHQRFTDGRRVCKDCGEDLGATPEKIVKQ